MPIKLTKREEEIKELIIRGKSQKQISKELGIASSTIKLHVKNLSEKLGVSEPKNKMKAIIKKLTNKKFLRWRNDRGHLYEVSTGTCIKLSDMDDVDSYLIVDQYGAQVNEMIKEKVNKAKYLKGKKEAVLKGALYYKGCKICPRYRSRILKQNKRLT